MFQSIFTHRFNGIEFIHVTLLANLHHYQVQHISFIHKASEDLFYPQNLCSMASVWMLSNQKCTLLSLLLLLCLLMETVEIFLLCFDLAMPNVVDKGSVLTLPQVLLHSLIYVLFSGNTSNRNYANLNSKSAAQSDLWSYPCAGDRKP